MRTWQGRPQLRYEADLDLCFPEEVATLPGGRALYNCIQCGTCSGTCPLAVYMDQSPRKIIAMTRAGFRDEVLESFTIWLCASCYQCTVECPRQIRITDFMSELKQRALEKNLHPKRLAPAVLAREFFESVRRRGRNSEGRLLLRLYAKTNPFAMLRMTRLGLRLIATGRFSLKADSIQRRGELQAIFSAVESARRDRAAGLAGGLAKEAIGA